MADSMGRIVEHLHGNAPVLVAGPTASGKSALAMNIAARLDGVIINADALQVYDDWPILSARPTPEDEAAYPHALYGHVPGDMAYSVGAWLADLKPLLAGDRLPVIVGGTGLYFRALTEGLADIPPIPAQVRAKGEARLHEAGAAALIADLDEETAAMIDTKNPMRVLRAWEVQAATGRGLAFWQAHTPPPLLPLASCQPIVLEADKTWLNARIAQRFDAMLAAGALEEARANLVHWAQARPSAKTIGAKELIAHLKGDLSLEQARDSATLATRQFAKRQRTWFRARMKAWRHVRIS